MNATQAENLRILIRHMETKVTRTLDMLVVSKCGTPACALGEAGAIGIGGLRLCASPTSLNLVYEGRSYPMSAIVGPVFGLVPGGYWLEAKQAHRLFCAKGSNAFGSNAVTPQEWAVEARKILAENGYAMDAPDEKPDAFVVFMAKVREPVAVEA